MKTKKILALFMAIFMTIAVLAACKDENGDSTGTTGGASATAPGGTGTGTAGATDTVEQLDILEDANYDGYTFDILTWAPAGVEWQYSTFNLTSDDTDTRMNEALYKRNQAIADRLGCVIKEDTSGNAVSLNSINSIVLSDPDEYDLVLLKDRTAFSAACEGLTVAYTELPEVDLTKSWWYPSTLEQLTVNGNVYFAYGVHNLDNFNMMQIMLFNAKHIKDNKLENPYDLVASGEWTIDKMYTMAMAFADDLNGDDKRTPDDDRFGVAAASETWYPNFGAVSGHDAISKDDNDMPVINVLNDETLVEIWQKVLDYESQEKSVIITSWDDIGSYNKTANRYDNAALIFADGKSLFLGGYLTMIDTIQSANMKDVYGIIPFPTYNEKAEGEDYVGYMYGAGNTFVVPANASNLERTSVILEVMAYESYNIVLPELYEIKTLIRNNPDDQAKEILIMLNNNRRIDLSIAYWYDIGTAYLPCFSKGTDTFVSTYQQNSEKYQGIIDDSLAKLEFYQ